MRLAHQQDTQLWFDGRKTMAMSTKQQNESQMSSGSDSDQLQRPMGAAEPHMKLPDVELQLEAQLSPNAFKSAGKAGELEDVESRVSGCSPCTFSADQRSQKAANQVEGSKSKIQLISHNHQLTISQPVKKPTSPSSRFTCNECTKPISDRYIMKVFSSREQQQNQQQNQVDENCLLFHENCLKCSICNSLLDKSCFIRDSKLLCARDYLSVQRLAGGRTASEFKCIACCQPIGPLELVMRVHSNSSIYHLACFTCFLCSRTLTRGDRYLVLDNGRVLCTMHQPQAHPNPQAQRVSAGGSPQPNHLQQYSISQYQCESMAPAFGPPANAYQYQQAFSVIQQQRAGKQAAPGLEGQSLLTAAALDCDPRASPQVFARSAFGQQRHSPLLSLSGVVDSVSAQEAKKAGHAKAAAGGPRAQARAHPNKRASKSGSFGQSNNPQQQQQQLSNSNQMTTSTGRIDGRRGPKRPRTILTTSQRRAFKNSFDLSQKPCRKVREALAKETGLSVRIVQVWFQNQRAKLKKIQRKQLPQQLHQTLAGSPGALGSPGGASAIPHHLHHAHHAHLHGHQQQHLSAGGGGHMNPNANPNLEQSRQQVQLQAQALQHQRLQSDFMLSAAIMGEPIGQAAPQRPHSSKGAGPRRRAINESEGELSRSASELGSEPDEDEDDDEIDDDDDDELDEEEELEEEEIEEEEEEEPEGEEGACRAPRVGVASACKQEKGEAAYVTSNAP